ncbi:MAG: hypothetical protein VKK04_15810 [Synechococcales bacterium]|nr:hypothetical protein [Synechococcales bacterium]
MRSRVQSSSRAFERIHVLNYEAPGCWSRLVTVPKRGILITPPQGQAMSYLSRRR